MIQELDLKHKPQPHNNLNLNPKINHDPNPTRITDHINAPLSPNDHTHYHDKNWEIQHQHHYKLSHPDLV